MTMDTSFITRSCPEQSEARSLDFTTDDLPRLIHDYLIRHSVEYPSLALMRKIGWESQSANKHFKKQRNNADNASPQTQEYFFEMMRCLCEEIQASTKAVKITHRHSLILDICAAPGGFGSKALEYNPDSQICAISLPRYLGGHEFLQKYAPTDPRVKIQFLDITKLGIEYGLAPHELEMDMLATRPYQDKVVDLAFCDGQLLRTNQKHRSEDDEHNASRKLLLSQLIFALHRLRNKGNMIVLLHLDESYHLIDLLRMFSLFADIQLYKSLEEHASRNSFYLIAQNVQVDSAPAQAALQKWKAEWRNPAPTPTAEQTEALLADFGATFVDLCEPVWQIQKHGIFKAKWWPGALAEWNKSRPSGEQLVFDIARSALVLRRTV